MKKWAIYILVIYIIMAFTWWTFLLLKRNRELTQLRIELHKDSHENIQKTSEKQHWMIISEGFVLGLSLLVGVVIIFRSYRKELQLTRNQNNFLLSVSHELKSPLTSIRLSLDTIRKRQPEMSKLLEINDIALKETSRLEKLIEEILITTRLEAGNFSVFSETDLLALLKEIRDDFSAIHSDKILLSTIVPGSFVFKADALLLRSAIGNIIENAFKYGRNQPVTLEAEIKKETLQIRIADKGNGISDEEKKLIFSKFYRVGNEQTRTAHGVGLGLYLAKLITDMHQGKIKVMDNQPSGCIFVLEFSKIAL